MAFLNDFKNTEAFKIVLRVIDGIVIVWHIM